MYIICFIAYYHYCWRLICFVLYLFVFLVVLFEKFFNTEVWTFVTFSKQKSLHWHCLCVSRTVLWVLLYGYIIGVFVGLPNSRENFFLFYGNRRLRRKKFIVFLGSALISLWPSVRNFYSRVKKLIACNSLLSCFSFSQPLFYHCFSNNKTCYVWNKFCYDCNTFVRP